MRMNSRKIARRCAILTAGALLAFAVSWCVIDPHLECADSYPGGTLLRDDAGRLLRVTLGSDDTDCRPDYVADPDDWIVKALVAGEDHRFFSHHGVNVLSVLRAAAQNVFARRRISGASTLTMQVARLIAPHPRTLAWKYVEAFRAWKIERVRDKRWILSQYLNRAPFGSNFIGIEAAANGWFDKRAKDLGLGEAALLAGLVQSPSRFRPDRHLDRALVRRDYILSRLLALGQISRDQYEGARTVTPRLRRGPRPFAEPFFCDWALRHVARANGRTSVHDFTTTLNADIQAQARQAVAVAAATGLSAAAVVLRVDTGAVVALACSDDYFSPDAGQVNTALAPRPAGSTLKPFLLALALDQGLVTPDEMLSDVPRAYHGYNPQNFDTRHRGTVSAADALVLSLNLPFVQLLERVGLPSFGNTLRALGCNNMNAPNETFGLGMAIGNVQVSLLELVNAYACLARGGTGGSPCALVQEVDAARKGARLRLFSSGACALVSDILSGEERSASALGHIAAVQTARFAWKTGTSAAFRDAWTIAWNPEFVVGVWCGHKSGHFGDTQVVGAHAAAPACWELARALYPSREGPWFPPSPEIVTREICAESGLPAAPECPVRKQGRALRGRSSNVLCTLHRTGLDGTAETRHDAFVGAFTGKVEAAARLAIQKPDDNTTFRLVPGLTSQRIVCSVVGNPASGRLWWFVDGRPSGETNGSQKFVWTPEIGTHRISCSAANGVSASVTIHVVTE